MVRPRSVPTRRQQRYAAFAVQQTGARYIGRTKTGSPLYELGGAVFKTRQLELGRANYARYKFGVSKREAKKYAGL